MVVRDGGGLAHPPAMPRRFAASEVEGLRRGSVAAVGVPSPAEDTERSVVVAETREALARRV